MSESREPEPDTSAASEASAAGGFVTGPSVASEEHRVQIRRAPKVSVFLVLGALVGMLGALVSTAAFEVDPLVGFAATCGYLCVYFVPAGLLLGALVALALDARSRRRSKSVTVAHDSVSPSQAESVQEVDAASGPELGTDQP